MPDFEGSVDSESDFEDEVTNENDEQNVNNQEEESTETKTEETQTETKETSQDQDKTDKGTKLDPDPVSRANQLRANAESKLRDYEMLLNNPEALKKYLGQFETEPKKQDEIEEMDPDKINTTDDLRKYAKYLKSATEKQIGEIKKGIEQDRYASQVEKTGQRIASEIDSIQNRYPQLRETNADGSKNPDFDPELDRVIGEFYNSIDFDPKSQTYRGNVSFAKVAESFMSVVKQGEASGSRKAQTIVKDKRLGRAQSGTVSKSSEPDESSMSAGQLIASRMKRMARK